MMGRDELIRRLVNVQGFRAAARRALPQSFFDFADGGAEDERTLRQNEAAFLNVALLPRPLAGSPERDLSIELFGKRLAMPLLIGPTGSSGMLWPDGECQALAAAEAAGIGFCLSHASTLRIEDLPKAGTPRWMQVFVYRDRGLTRQFAERAQGAGYDALVLTIDNQMLGMRERDIRNGFTIPPQMGPAMMMRIARRPGWLWRMRERRASFTFANYAGVEAANLSALAARMAALLDPSMSWDDVAMLRRAWQGPLILKGVLHPGDVQLALDHGVDGIIVSNHGGRQLDRAIDGLTALPAIARAADGRMPILLDGGIRRGVDLMIARAMGATACLIARPHLWGLAVAGRTGVEAVLEILRRDLDRAMGLCGLRRIDEIGPDLLHVPDVPPVPSPARALAA